MSENTTHEAPPASPVLVLGSGVAGLVAALACASQGIPVQLVGPADITPGGRTVALLEGSVQLLRNLGLWDNISPRAAPLKTMRIVDDTGSLFAIPPVDFRAGEIGLGQFGFNIALHELTAALLDAAQNARLVSLHPGKASQIDFAVDGVRVRLEDGTLLESHLLVAADGRDSLARHCAGIGTRAWAYPQTALTAVFAHRQPHGDTSTEFQTRSGPCTLVPMPAQPDGLHRSSLVWLMSPDLAHSRAALDDRSFASAVQRQTHFLLGAMRVEGPRGMVPMSGLMASSTIGQRLALIGEAAHVFPPIGAQGLNLGLRDAADLAECLTADAGAEPTANALRKYENLRRGDIQSRTLAVDALNRSLLTPLLPVDFLRGAGLMALAHIGPLRRMVMRAGVQPQRIARLMQARIA